MSPHKILFNSEHMKIYDTGHFIKSALKSPIGFCAVSVVAGVCRVVPGPIGPTSPWSIEDR